MLVTSNAWERVLQLSTSKGKATAFTLNFGDDQWLVTAAHVLPGEPAPEVTVANRFVTRTLRLGFIPPLAPRADVAVARLPEPLTTDLQLPATSDGVVPSQGTFFLGFPFGLTFDLGGGPMPFVKHAFLSAGRREDGVKLWYLDGHGNKGFSGGPVVTQPLGSDALHVIAVVSRNQPALAPLRAGERTLKDVSAVENPGIIIATDIGHVIETIDARG